VTEQELIEKCRRGKRAAQKELYNRYAPILMGLCRRYVRNEVDAEDIMIEGMYKIMTKIGQYKGKGSFEGWMKRIMVNEALMFLRKKHNFTLNIEISNIDRPHAVTVEDELAAKDILKLLDLLPTGYRTVFNLYVLEGYKHREIADILGISINTSKSQLILAKKRLGELVKLNHISDTG
jgi:RNA polymerase sigma-70 factor (ECF subfamily)